MIKAVARRWHCRYLGCIRSDKDMHRRDRRFVLEWSVYCNEDRYKARLENVVNTAPAEAGNDSSVTAHKGYAPINGLDLYYETYGSGAPLILLHGGINPGNVLGANLAKLAETGL